jgi:nucleotide-binding universal stress UspA family protein
MHCVDRQLRQDPHSDADRAIGEPPMKGLRLRTILAALSVPDARSQPVINRAAQICAAFNAELVLFHAAFESALSGRPFFDSKRLARSREWRVGECARALEGHAKRLRTQRLTVRTEVLGEEPAHESIIRATIRIGADLVVAGPHVRGRPNKRFALRRLRRY